MSRSLVALAVVILVVVIGVCTSTVATIHALRATAQRARHSGDVLEATLSLMAAVDAAEDADRSFVLTQDASYAAAFASARDRITLAFGDLRQAMSAPGGGRTLLPAIEAQTGERLASLGHSIELARRDPRAAAAFIRSGIGDRQMQALRASLAQLRDREQERLGEEDEAAERLSAWCEGSAWTGTAVVVLTLGCGLQLLRAQARRRLQAERAVEAAHARLAEEVVERTADLAATNARLQAQTRELTALNEQLDAFCATVSHDLRAPLRVIEGLARILERRLGSHLDPRDQADLTLLTGQTRTMRSLIEDLLAFARMARQVPHPTHIAMQALVEECWQVAAREVRGREVACTIAALPPAWGDPQLLRQVFANLLGNALKYTRDRNPAQIEVSGRLQEDGLVRYQVRDNGIGFDQDQAVRLFEPFTRLSGAEDFEGTGIGLAIVRRIVERHGGQVWAEGAPGQGAVFSLTLPSQGPAPPPA